MMQGSLAERLRVLRARQGLSLTEASKRAGITRDTLSDLERGKRHAYMPTLAKIAQGYGVPVEDLLEEPVPKAVAPQGSGQPERKDPLSGWISHALTEGDFAQEFERAKGSQELADELHRKTIAEVTERNQTVATLRQQGVQPAEILKAQRDLTVARARLTAAAFLSTDRGLGRDVSHRDPRTIVARVIHTQSGEFLAGEASTPVQEPRESA